MRTYFYIAVLVTGSGCDLRSGLPIEASPTDEQNASAAQEGLEKAGNEQRGYIYVTNSDAGTVTILDAQGVKVSDVEVGSDPGEIEIMPGGLPAAGTVYIAARWRVRAMSRLAARWMRRSILILPWSISGAITMWFAQW